jgi:hypothetical protein
MSSTESRLALPQPNTLAGRLWTAGDPGKIDEMMASAVASLNLSALELGDLSLYAQERSAAIRTLAQALGQPENEAELYPAIAAFWLELRFDWQRHNEVMNYASARMMELPRVAGHGAVCSAILGRLEDLLLPEHRDQLAGHAIRLLEGVVPPQNLKVNPS